MRPEIKYQVWIEDAHLAGHIYVPRDDTPEDVANAAQDFVRDTWGAADDNEISVCAISDTYYQDIANCTAEDSILLGM
jgi:hypothetical protein